MSQLPTTPPSDVPDDQAWFWTPDWLTGEHEVDDALTAGDTTFYDSDEAFLAALGDEFR